MAKLRLKYVNEYVDSTGKIRRYFRRGGKQLGAIPGEVGSEEFMTSYQAYLSKQPQKAKSTKHPDSLGKLIEDFYTSRLFTDVKPGSRAAYRSALDSISKLHGHRLATDMTAEHAEKIINKIGETKPGMANLTRAALRQAFKYAVKKKLRPDNPFLGIESFKMGEHHTWTEGELKQYQDYWKVGTRERLAFDLLLYTGQRSGDVAKMKRADISDGLIHIVQQKTGTELWVPVHPNLARSMAAYTVTGLNLIGDPAGRPIARPALSAFIQLAASKAGLPTKCVPHGLRKAALRRLAEADGTAKQIAAISGHKSLKEVERYTKAADQIKLARAGMAKLTKEQ